MAQEPSKEQRRGKTYEDELYEILNDIGVIPSEDFNLILHNDSNDMIHVVVALYEICRLSNERCVRVMMEAHHKGKSVITTDELNVVLDMKWGLDKRGLTTSIETSE